MKITIEPHNPEWRIHFEAIKKELAALTGPIHPEIEHIGSTSVEGLAAKPIIDILVGLKNEADLSSTPQLLMAREYIYFEKYNTAMPYRRFFVKLKTSPKSLSLPVYIRPEDPIPDALNEQPPRLAHIHALPLHSEHWTRHIAFRDYLRAHPIIRVAYQQLKEALSLREWKDGIEYNEAKDAFIKTEERNAVNWYLQQHNNNPA
ncbi:GrpB family protein [Niabella beijingensis]|uniref:GrpB family protein n=1 Tax=Niabella beijingensis TaxID=2872700 RepID=UPI001CC1663C|nr:GrpB family protein [Niabella beijingensis]MBZ4187253.1 GrpB family protein [Niabella beijingensis]